MPVEFLLAPDGQSFVGREDDGSWWAGARSTPVALAIPDRLDTPRAALRRFAVAGELARAGAADAWAEAGSAVDFGPEAASLSREAALERTRRLFELVDFTTFRLEAIPEPVAENQVEVVLEQPGTLATLPLTLRRDDEGSWRILAPASAEMAALRAQLLADRGGRFPAEDAFRMRRSPRDAIRAFLDGMARWDEGGREQALETLDLSAYPEVLRDSIGEMSAHFLRRALDRIGMAGLQSIPNDHADRSPYVHFAHPVGRIVLAPFDPEPDAPWVFTRETVADIEDLYRALDDLPAPLVAPPGRVPEAPFFAVRDRVAAVAPALLGRVLGLEYWQMLGAISVLSVAALLGGAAAWAASRALGRLGGLRRQPLWFLLAVGVAVALAAASPFRVMLGIPPHIRALLVPIISSVGIVLTVAALWRLLRVLGGRLTSTAQRTFGMADDIVLSLALAALRSGLVVAAALIVAYILSIPTAGILAGLGIGGLAVAYASRETLSNIFGALVLVSDRPFRRGDWIITEKVAGAVEQVGIRSTRVRDAEGGMIVVPNGKLADSSIQNISAGSHRLMRLQIPITGGAASGRLAAFIEAARERIASDPSFASDDVLVGIETVSGSCVEVSVTARLAAGDPRAVAAARQQLLLDLMRLAEQNELNLGPAPTPHPPGELSGPIR